MTHLAKLAGQLRYAVLESGIASHYKRLIIAWPYASL
jgi:hypothetical protein